MEIIPVDRKEEWFNDKDYVEDISKIENTKFVSSTQYKNLYTEDYMKGKVLDYLVDTLVDKDYELEAANNIIANKDATISELAKDNASAHEIISSIEAKRKVVIKKDEDKEDRIKKIISERESKLKSLGI